MKAKKLFLSILIITSTLLTSMQRRAFNSVQALVERAHQMTDAPHYHRPPAPSSSESVSHARQTYSYPPQPQQYTAPRFDYSPPTYYTRPSTVVYSQVYTQPQTVIVPVEQAPQIAVSTPVGVTSESITSEEPWLTPTKVVVGLGCALLATYIIYKISQAATEATIPPAIVIPEPVISAPEPTQTPWDLAYMYLSQPEQYIIDSLQLYNQQDRYIRMLKNSPQERQELYTLTQSSNKTDLVRTAQTQFVQQYLSFEQQPNNSDLAQAVALTHDRLIILYMYFKK